MKNFDCAVLGFLAGMVAMVFFTLAMYQGSDMQNLEMSSMKAKQKCEASLPRNQSCEVVVTAKIKDIKEN